MFGVNSEMEIEVIEREPAVQGLQKTLTERELALDHFTDLQSAVEALQKTQEALREVWPPPARLRGRIWPTKNSLSINTPLWL